MIDSTTYNFVARYREIIAGLVVAYAACEVVWFYLVARRAQPGRQIACNLAIFLVGATLRKVTFVVSLAIFGVAYAASPWRIPSNPWTAAACYIAVDFAVYWFHRCLHETRLGWAVHSVHHSGSEYELSLGVRTSWVLGLVDDLIHIPLCLLGFHPALVLGMVVLNRFGQFWGHTEMVGRLGILDRLLNTPSNHRVHHANVPGAARHNYGSSFMVWDHLFGTYAPEGAPLAYGIDTGDPGANPLRVQFDGLWRWFQAVQAPTATPSSRPALLDRVLQIGFTTFFVWWIVSYTSYYGAPVLLWFCSIANLYLLLGVWSRRPLWFSLAGVSVLPIQLAFSVALGVSWLTGGKGGGVVGYMLDPMIPAAIRATSLYHVVCPVLIVSGLVRFGYDRRALWLQTGLALGILALCYFAVDVPIDPPGPPGSTFDRVSNVNWVRGFPAAGNLATPWPHFLWLCVAYPLLVHWPAHRVFMTLPRLVAQAARGHRRLAPWMGAHR